jgi:hypothetical protein
MAGFTPKVSLDAPTQPFVTQKVPLSKNSNCPIPASGFRNGSNAEIFTRFEVDYHTSVDISDFHGNYG